MVPATQRFYEAVLNGAVSHSGDPRLARHVDNCTIKTDQRGSRLAKDAKNSPRKIDLAVAAVMAHERAHAPVRAAAVPMVAWR
jgi:phage terminase large subunit-like protein